MQTRLFIFLLIATNLSCYKATTPTVEKSKTQVSKTEVLPEPLIVRIKKDEATVLAQLSLRYEGSDDIKLRLSEKKETVQNLVIQTVSEFSFSELQSRSGKKEFQKQLLNSINQFVGKKTFERIDILEIKEI